MKTHLRRQEAQQQVQVVDPERVRDDVEALQVPDAQRVQQDQRRERGPPPADVRRRGVEQALLPLAEGGDERGDGRGLEERSQGRQRVARVAVVASVRERVAGAVHGGRRARERERTRERKSERGTMPFFLQKRSFLARSLLSLSFRLAFLSALSFFSLALSLCISD